MIETHILIYIQVAKRYFPTNDFVSHNLLIKIAFYESSTCVWYEIYEHTGYGTTSGSCKSVISLVVVK